MKNIEKFLQMALKEGRFPHGIILHGKDRSALERNALALAKWLTNCEDLSHCNDFICLRPQGKMRQICIEDVRKIADRIQFVSLGNGHRVIVICDAERMHRYAANAILKSLEEPPSGIVFLLTTCHLQRILGTIRSRCQAYGMDSQDDFATQDPHWRTWLTDWKWLVEEVLREPRSALLLDAYVLMENFQNLLKNENQDFFPETDGDDEHQLGYRQWMRESRLGECMKVLYETTLEHLPEDGNGRRIAIYQLARRMRAIERCLSLLSVNYGEGAAIESFVLSLFVP
jgi:hypothetical protein